MTQDDRKILTAALRQSTMALHGLYEAVERLSEGADRALLKSQKMTLERIIERHVLYFITGEENTQ